MENIRCPICGSEMELEEISSYYADPDWEWICQNPNCKSNEE